MPSRDDLTPLQHKLYDRFISNGVDGEEGGRIYVKRIANAISEDFVAVFEALIAERTIFSQLTQIWFDYSAISDDGIESFCKSARHGLYPSLREISFAHTPTNNSARRAIKLLVENELLPSLEYLHLDSMIHSTPRTILIERSNSSGFLAALVVSQYDQLAQRLAEVERKLEELGVSKSGGFSMPSEMVYAMASPQGTIRDSVSIVSPTETEVSTKGLIENTILIRSDGSKYVKATKRKKAEITPEEDQELRNLVPAWKECMKDWKKEHRSTFDIILTKDPLTDKERTELRIYNYVFHHNKKKLDELLSHLEQQEDAFDRQLVMDHFGAKVYQDLWGAHSQTIASSSIYRHLLALFDIKDGRSPNKGHATSSIQRSKTDHRPRPDEIVQIKDLKEKLGEKLAEAVCRNIFTQEDADNQLDAAASSEDPNLLGQILDSVKQSLDEYGQGKRKS